MDYQKPENSLHPPIRIRTNQFEHREYGGREFDRCTSFRTAISKRYQYCDSVVERDVTRFEQQYGISGSDRRYIDARQYPSLLDALVNPSKVCKILPNLNLMRFNYNNDEIESNSHVSSLTNGGSVPSSPGPQTGTNRRLQQNNGPSSPGPQTGTNRRLQQNNGPSSSGLRDRPQGQPTGTIRRLQRNNGGSTMPRPNSSNEQIINRSNLGEPPSTPSNNDENTLRPQAGTPVTEQDLRELNLTNLPTNRWNNNGNLGQNLAQPPGPADPAATVYLLPRGGQTSGRECLQVIRKFPTVTGGLKNLDDLPENLLKKKKKKKPWEFTLVNNDPDGIYAEERLLALKDPLAPPRQKPKPQTATLGRTCQRPAAVYS